MVTQHSPRRSMQKQWASFDSSVGSFSGGCNSLGGNDFSKWRKRWSCRWRANDTGGRMMVSGCIRLVGRLGGTGLMICGVNRWSWKSKDLRWSCKERGKVTGAAQFRHIQVERLWKQLITTRTQAPSDKQSSQRTWLKTTPASSSSSSFSHFKKDPASATEVMLQLAAISEKRPKLAKWEVCYTVRLSSTIIYCPQKVRHVRTRVSTTWEKLGVIRYYTKVI